MSSILAPPSSPAGAACAAAGRWRELAADGSCDRQALQVCASW